MDLWDVAKVMWRRRGVTVPLLLLSAIAAVFALLTIPPAYSARAQVAFLAAPAGAAPQAANPFTVGGLADFLSIALNRQEFRQQLAQEGLVSDYRVTFESEDLPVIGFEVVGKESEVVTLSTARLIRLVQAEAAKLQTNAGQGQAITVAVVDPGDDVRVVRAAGRRALAIIAGVGLLATAGVALAVDALIRRRSRVSEPSPRRLLPRQAAPAREWASGSRVTPRPGMSSAATASTPVGEALAGLGGEAVPETEAAGDRPEKEGAPEAEAAVEASKEQAPPVVYSPDSSNAVTVLLDQASPESMGDNDATVVLPLAGVSRPNGKQQKVPIGKRKTGDAPDRAKKR